MMNEVLRQEKKFLITLPQYYRYSHQLGRILEPDPYSLQGGYRIRSLYFDSIDDRDYWGKKEGLELRRKIRLRNYGPDAPFAILEMKQKQGAMQRKRSLHMDRADAARLVAGDYSVLLQYGGPFAAECFSLLHLFCYRPRAIVSYRRKAFAAKENRIRITFDYPLTGTESCYDIFSNRLPEDPLLDPALVVLEVKYNGFLLSYIKDMLRECSAGELSVSKYCLGRAAGLRDSFLF